MSAEYCAIQEAMSRDIAKSAVTTFISVAIEAGTATGKTSFVRSADASLAGTCEVLARKQSDAIVKAMQAEEMKSWTRDSRFLPLLDALQEEIDRYARERSQFPGDHPEYTRGLIDGLVRAKGMAGYHAQYSLREEAQIREMLESPKAQEELAQAEVRLAAGDVKGAKEVRSKQGHRIRARLEPNGKIIHEKNASHIRERLEPGVDSSGEPEIDG